MTDQRVGESAAFSERMRTASTAAFNREKTTAYVTSPNAMGRTKISAATTA